MSGRVFSRPRTRVYNSNYAAGESYYKSALDGLDRKYGRSPAPEAPPASNGSLSALRASLERDIPQSTRRSQLNDDEDLELPRRKTNSASLLGEFDSILERRGKGGNQREKTPVRSIKALEDDIDQEFSETMKRMKSRARAAVEDDDFESSRSTLKQKEVKGKRFDFSGKLIESVGVTEEGVKSGRKALTIVSSPSDSEDLTRWTAVKSGRRHVLDDDGEESVSQAAAAARARKSRARLDDLEAEMQALEERGAAREKRLRDLRTLLSENETASQDTLQSTVRVKSTVKTEKKVVSY